MNTPYNIKQVEYLGEYRLRLTFADGLVGEIDLAAKLDTNVGPMFQPLRDQAFFAQVHVDVELGTIAWPNGADLAPEVLHDQAVPVAQSNS